MATSPERFLFQEGHLQARLAGTSPPSQGAGSPVQTLGCCFPAPYLRRGRPSVASPMDEDTCGRQLGTGSPLPSLASSTRGTEGGPGRAWGQWLGLQWVQPSRGGSLGVSVPTLRPPTREDTGLAPAAHPAWTGHLGTDFSPVSAEGLGRFPGLQRGPGPIPPSLADRLPGWGT